MNRIRLVTAASKWTVARAREFGSNRSGSVMIVGAIVLPILFLVAGMAVDYGSASSSATRLQEMADAAAIAAAKELVLANADEDQLQSVAQLSIDTNIEANPSDVLDSIRVKASVSASAGTVSVKLSAMHNNVFGGFLNPPKMQIIRHSTAQALGGVKLCILGLHRSENGAIRLEQNAKITANGCAVYSNSMHGDAIKTKNSSEISAGLICAVGGTDGDSGSFSPSPITDCPELPDPLASRPAPSVSSCDETDLEIDDMTTTLSPGVYCGGLEIEGSSNVTFESGIYIIQDGPLEIKNSATVRGEHTGFYFVGSGAELKMDKNTSVELSAPKDGEMAGLLFYQHAKSAKSGARFRIDSNDARVLLGTIYLPAADFYVDADRPIADQSAYTVIIAEKFKLYGGPNLVLNTDYADTEVPVPDGILNQNAKITLVK